MIGKRLMVTNIMVLVVLMVMVSIKTVSAQKIVTIGISQWVSNDKFKSSVESFKNELTERGYVEGRNIKYIQKSPEGDIEKQWDIIESFVEEGVDLIFTQTTFGTLVARDVTSDTPIVFTIVTYPVKAEIIESLESSGNNLVGTRNYVSPARQFFIFEKLFSKTRRLGFVHRKGEPNSDIQYNEFKKVLAKRKIEVVDLTAIDLDDMANLLESYKDKVDALYSACDTLIQSGGEEVVINFSLKYNKPSFTCNESGVDKGALVGNVANWSTIAKMSAEKAILILKGTGPTQILTESPREDYIVVNTKTAKQLGLQVPQDILNKAKKIIRE